MKKFLAIILTLAMLMLTSCKAAETVQQSAAAAQGQSAAQSAEELPLKTADTDIAESEEAQWEVMSEAYQFTFPLVLMDWTMKAATNTEAPDMAGHAPVNQLIHAQKLADAKSKIVVTMNVDTVYTQAWLDLSKEPMVYVMPKADRFFQVQVLDAWTNTPAVLKEAGTYMFVAPDWNGEVPEGMVRIDIPTSMVWMIGRVLVNDANDMKNVRAIQNEMKLLPLSAYVKGGDYQPEAGQRKDEYQVVPIEAVLKMGPKEYFDAANRLMEKNPPAAADENIIGKLKQLNIGPGLTFDVAALQGDVKAHWTNMLQSIRSTLLKAGAQYQVTLGDWTYYGEPIGNFGDAYDYRAMIALGGLGANPIEVAVYAKTGIAADGQPLNGAYSYQLHFDTLPPITDGGFWSVTAYGSDDFLIANPIERYCVNDRSEYKMNEDGSLDVILSKDAPEDQSNWLPVGEDGFHLFMRIYLPDMNELDSVWTAPVVTKLS